MHCENGKQRKSWAQKEKLEIYEVIVNESTNNWSLHTFRSQWPCARKGLNTKFPPNLAHLPKLGPYSRWELRMKCFQTLGHKICGPKFGRSMGLAQDVYLRPKKWRISSTIFTVAKEEDGPEFFGIELILSTSLMMTNYTRDDN